MRAPASTTKVRTAVITQSQPLKSQSISHLHAATLLMPTWQAGFGSSLGRGRGFVAFRGILVFSLAMPGGTERGGHRGWRPIGHSLSGRLFRLTVVFVLASV